jgi:predicted ATPase
MNCYEDFYRRKGGNLIVYPCISFNKDNWDDFGFKTTFKVYYYTDQRNGEEIGDIKILDISTQYTTVPDAFNRLGPGRCSLGQSLEYYANMKRFFPETYETILNDLKDIAISTDLATEFEDADGFRSGLLRFGSAEKAFRDAKLFLDENLLRESKALYFTYLCKIEAASEPHIVDFDFKITDELPFRINVIIGKNGTGKTHYLGSLVNAISGVEDKKNFTPFIPLFNRVIAISYSLFDDFPKPAETTVFSYKYIGLRTSSEAIVSDERLSEKLQTAFKLIVKKDRQFEWYTIVNKIVPLEHLGLQNANDISDSWTTQLSYQQAKRLSSGQSIILFILTELIASIQEESLILFDEPETHLHPTAIAQLMNCFTEILDTYNSFAIISTHSPIIIQDVPAKYISVFERIGNLPLIKKLPIESFGENLSVLTNTVFGTADIKELYKKHLEKLERQIYSSEEINRFFNNKLSFNAMLYLAALFSADNEKS